MAYSWLYALRAGVELTLSCVVLIDRLSRVSPPKTAMSTWLPYTFIDQLLTTNEQTQCDLSKRAINLCRDLHLVVRTGLGEDKNLAIARVRNCVLPL
jgi:hypothetical protein